MKKRFRDFMTAAEFAELKRAWDETEPAADWEPTPMTRPNKPPRRPPCNWLVCEECRTPREDAKFDERTKLVLCNYHWQMQDREGGREPPYTT